MNNFPTVKPMNNDWRQTLLAEQLEQVGNKRKAKTVKVPVSNESEYRVELNKIIHAVRQDINEQIVPIVKSVQAEYTADAVSWVELLSSTIDRVIARWRSPEFERLAQLLASRFVRSTADVTRGRFQRSVKSLGLDIYGDSPAVQDYIDMSVYDNVALIKSIPEQYLGQVRSIVNTNVRAGLRPSAMIPQLQKQFGVTERRARFIARDQTAKLNGDLAKKRQIDAGFPYFQWDDSDDERVRTNHSDIANRVTAYGKGIYRWDNPPLSDDGTPIIPGQDYNCRCTARPVDQREVDENIKAGRTNPNVRR
jgi:SPP1 gp7 family putative phage head morphogenesis protein